jgi:hypothetical protein
MVLQVSPTQYLAWREALWCTHRVVRMLALSFTDAYFNSSTLVAHWTRFAALGMLMDALGFKVRAVAGGAGPWYPGRTAAAACCQLLAARLLIQTWTWC